PLLLLPCRVHRRHRLRAGVRAAQVALLEAPVAVPGVPRACLLQAVNPAVAVRACRPAARRVAPKAVLRCPRPGAALLDPPAAWECPLDRVVALKAVARKVALKAAVHGAALKAAVRKVAHKAV